jgi:hypothetical protein
MPSPLLPPVREEFRAIATAIVPEASSLRPDEWLELEALVEEQLAPRPPAMQRQLVTFIRVIALIARLRFLRPLHRLSDVHVRRVLESLERSPVLLLRRGTWGLRTLVFLGYYTRPGVAASLGYRAHAGGWEARHAADRMERSA